MRNTTHRWMCSLAAIAIAALPGTASAYELVLDDDAQTEVSRDDAGEWTLRVRLSPPLTNVEILDDELGTTAIVAGSVELDFLTWVGVEVGGSWLHTESLDEPAWDVFVRGIGLLPLYDGRDGSAAGDGEGWEFTAVGALGYRFLHEVDELEELRGSLDMHAATVGAGARATWWWADPRVGLELRLLPTVSIALAESTDGAWGITSEDVNAGGTTNPVVVPTQQQQQQPPGGGGGAFPFFGGGGSNTAAVGNADETDWGLDFEITVGLAF